MIDALGEQQLLERGLQCATVLASTRHQGCFALAQRLSEGLLRLERCGKPGRASAPPPSQSASDGIARSAAGAEAPAVSARRPEANDVTAQNLRLLSVGVAFVRRDLSAVEREIRAVCQMRPYSIPFWHVFNELAASPQCAGLLEKFRTHLIQLLMRFQDSLPLMLLVGHQLRGGLRIAEYLRAYRLRPQSPLISLCVGTTYLVQVMQKNTFNRHQTVLRAFTFLQQYHLTSAS
jgi:hypothetical protein